MTIDYHIAEFEKFHASSGTHIYRIAALDPDEIKRILGIALMDAFRKTQERHQQLTLPDRQRK